MTEVERTGLSTLIQSKKEEWRSIRTSRKRRLHELYCVATQADALPLIDTIADDSPPATADESKFHDDNAFLQGPFLNERNLPPRRIPPVNIAKHHDTAVGPVANSTHSREPEGTQSPGLRPPSLPEPQLPQPGNSTEARSASPKAPSPAPETSPSPTSAPVPRIGATDLPTHPNVAQAPDRAIPVQPPRPGAIAAENANPLEGSREVPAAREVAFVEPDAQSTGSEHGHGITQPHVGGPRDVEDRQRELDTDAMDLDETPGQHGEPSRLISLRPPLDSSKPQDILSSPGSTAQTVTTPAVHDASPDTSPDNEGPPYPGDDEELERAKVDQDDSARPEAVSEVEAEDSREPGAAQSASAQSLLESANAALPTNAHVQGSQSSPLANGTQSPVQAAASSRLSADAEYATDSKREMVTDASQSAVQTTHQAGPNETSRTLQPQSPAVETGDPGTRAPTGHGVQSASEPSIMIPAPAGEGLTPVHMQHESSADVISSTTAGDAQMSGTQLGFQQHESGATDLMLRKRSFAEKHALKRRKAPTVLFEKPPRKHNETIVASQGQGRPPRIPFDDYFVPLFFDGFARQSNWMKGPEQLLANTHKTLSSPDCSIVLQEKQACNVLRRIYHLQQHDKWSLRQPKRCPEPTRPPSHWDSLLREMKWMRTDFREERKWKKTVARNLADACAEWVASNKDERKLLQVNAKVPPLVDATSLGKDGSQAPEADSLPTSMPDLVPSNDADSPMDVDDEPRDWALETVAPSEIFALQDDEVVFGLQKSAASDLLLDELPLYGSLLKAPQPDLAVPEFDPDSRWRRPALPLSKYVEGEMVLKPPGPVLKRSRFNFAVEDESDDFEVAGSREHDQRTNLSPENTGVALFRPEMKMIRDRLHSGHQFRPPTESLMPLQSFYEYRLASVWTPAEDDELRRLVRDYAYNWSLISQLVTASLKSMFVSAEDRRTPWECFERWVQLEGFPNDTARTQYFQTYQRRIHLAQRAIEQANENTRPQVGQNGAVIQPQRRRPTLPFRVDRKPPKRPLAIIDCMKKLAKKREAAVAKQQQAANNQNRRTSNDNPQPKLPTKTPEDYSRLRHERDKQMHEKLMRFTQQQEAQRQASLQSMQNRAANQMGRVAAAPGAAQAAQNAAAAHAAGMANPLAARLAAGQMQVPGQGRARIPMQQQQAALAAQMAAGGLVSQLPVNVNGMTQAQQLAVLQAGQRMQVPDVNLVMQARRIQDQQRRQQAVQQQAQVQAQGQGQAHHHSPQQQGQQQQPQQIPPQHSPPQGQAQPIQQAHQNQPMPNGSAAQANSPVIRNGMNGMNQNFMMNNMGSYAPNGNGMATSPGGASMNLQGGSVGSAGSPPPGFVPQPRGMPPSMQAQFIEFENQFRLQHPEMSPNVLRSNALARYGQLYRQNMAKHSVVQNAMDAAAGSNSQQAQTNGIPNTTSPQQYAQLLRQQQQQQQMGQPGQPQVSQHQQQQQQQQAAIAQAAASRQMNQQQHQRQPSGGATQVPGR